MNQEELKESISRLLENITSHAQMMDEKNGDLTLDIDMVKEDLRELYRLFDKFLILNRESQEATPDPMPQQENEIDSVAEDSQKEVPKKEDPPPAPLTEKPVEKPVEKEKSSTSATPTGKTVIDLLSSYENQTIADRYISQDDNSLHNRISSNKEDRSIGARMQQHPINSLKDVIGVNEKFLFINELFQGNIQAYNESIARLNEMETLRTAFDYLNELGAAFDWDAKRSATTIEKFANYVQRRHMNQ